MVPAASTFENSTYFDEIYHARTAYENIRGVYPYEVSHPPLGKLLISLGIRVFGMTPFGWRVVGALFGVGMLPLLYVFIKNLFGKTALALCGTALFAFDFMHLTQTRIATIDTYGVFFIMAMYFFLYRWASLPADASFRRGALPLFLSGLSFGIGAACKWTVLYGAAGLAIVYFAHLFFTWRARHALENAPPFAPWAVKTLLFSVLVFVCIPAVIYCLSYIPYAQARDDMSLYGLLKTVWDNQKYMLSYHLGVTAAHPYSSKWWQWLFDIRPILYYRSDVTADGLRSAFAAFNNPVVSWTGFLAVIALAVRTVRDRCGTALFLTVGYLAQLVPWLFIARPTFAYHYFPSAVFLVLAICYLMNVMIERADNGRWRLPVYGLTGLSTGLYVLFYPVLAGVMVPTWYTTWVLKWFPSWPF
jgi:dolichyl-phosphate-mannose--protein O-mannosyl transferase